LAQGVTDRDKPISTWYFVNPDFFQNALDFLRENFEEAFTGTDSENRAGTKALFSEDACASLMRKLPLGACQKIDQYVGDLVHVPSGWMHAVFTCQDCVKLAWEVVNPTAMMLYTENWRDRMPRMHKNARDYVGFMSIVVEHFLSADWTLE